ncbi:hypothetical protein Vadar_013533 [Vaccinium darrowii]|nr:hypothetical protein Vadar_013533 [Vaccinium darrowii]
MKSYSNFEVKEPIEEPVEHVRESSHKSDSDVSEESEEAREEEREEDAEEELEDQEAGFEEEDPDEESSVEPCEESAEGYPESVSPDEDALKEITSKLYSHSEIDGDYHPSGSNDNQSKEKRSLDATRALDLCQVNQKKFRQEEPCIAESDAAKQLEHTGSSVKQRHSRWDENDGKTEGGNKTSKRRKTRWASEGSDLKMFGPIQLPDFITGLDGSDLDPKTQKLKLRLSVLNSKLLSSELHDDRPEEKRSPSPEAEYNNLGIRINTREARLREKLVGERQRVLSELMKNPIFNAPPDSKPPKLFKKLYIPVKEYPKYNFIGLIIGPRGNTLKNLEKETGARILLRGKGSSRAPDKKVDKSDDEDLHVCIEADNQKSLDEAVKKVEKLLIPVDEGMNDHKRAQLEELAKLRSNMTVCGVCNQVGHKGYACPNQQSTFKTVSTCATCGSFAHPSSGCPFSTPNTKGKPDREASDADLYVGYLPQAVDENRLRELFCPFAMAMTHMHGLKMEGKMLAVRVAGRPPPQGGSTQFPMYPGPPAVICANVPSRLSHLPMYPGPPAAISANAPSHLSHLPMYPGSTAAISANALSLKALPEPPAYMLPEAQSSFHINKGLGLPSSSLSLGHHNRLVESKGMDILSSVVSSHAGSQPASSFDSFYRYLNQIPFSSPGLTPQFPSDPDYLGSQLLSYSSVPTLKPTPP